MKNAMIPFDPSKLAMSLKRVANEAAGASALFLKMDKTGAWLYGADAEEAASTEQFMVNPEGFQLGYICWAKSGSEKLGEVIAPVTDALDVPDTVPPGGKGWEFQLGLHLKGVAGKGALAGKELVYRSSSVGGKKAIAALASLVSARLAEGDANMVPVVTLSSDSYKHKTYGKIFTPEINIVKWVPMPKADEPKAEAKPSKKRR